MSNKNFSFYIKPNEERVYYALPYNMCITFKSIMHSTTLSYYIYSNIENVSEDITVNQEVVKETTDLS